MPFSQAQIVVLAKIVADAWTKQDAANLIDLPGDIAGRSATEQKRWFRQAETAKALDLPKPISWSACNARRDYLAVKMHFEKLAGREGDAYATARRGQWAPRTNDGSSYAALKQLKEAQAAAGLSDGYVAHIALGKFQTSDLGTLSAKQLWHLCFTVKNRAKAKDGTGDTDTRNKKQTATRRAQSAAAKAIAENPEPMGYTCPDCGWRGTSPLAVQLHRRVAHGGQA